MSGTPLRIGDAEREHAAAELGEHFAQGRLSVEEHAERLERVWAAKTQAELVPVFGDLPGGAYGSEPGPPERPPTPRWRGRRFLPVPVFAAVPMLLLVAVLLHVPFLLFGVLALWFVARGPRHHARHGHLSSHHGCR